MVYLVMIPYDEQRVGHNYTYPEFKWSSVFLGVGACGVFKFIVLKTRELHRERKRAG